jgi:hypothetical protein
MEMSHLEPGGLPVPQERRVVRLAGSLLVGGELLAVIAGLFHVGTAKPNNHAAVFEQYAGSDAWTAVHIALFASDLLIVAGLIVLSRALARTQGNHTLALLIGSGAVLIAAASGVVLAVDGVALKQAVDAWVHAAPAEKALAFHDAETIRWLEWGANCFVALVQGVTVVLLGLAIGRSVMLPKWLGWVSVVAGVGYLAVGVVVGYDGFSDTVSALGIATSVLILIVSIGIAVAGWRGTGSGSAEAVAPSG